MLPLLSTAMGWLYGANAMTVRVKVGMTNTSVEIGQYREVNKGALKAFFSIVEYPHGRKTLDMRYFESGTNRWIAFPQKEVKKPNMDKPDYIPLVSYMDKEYDAQLKTAILEALKQQGNNGQANTHQKQANPLQDDASSVWFG